MATKLVRDRIPDIIRERGGDPVVRVASPDEYRRFLDEKLQEEVAEYLAAHDPEELADVLEVLYALAEERRLAPADLELLRAKKTSARGGFSRRYLLDA